jgi:hypothetical protein
MPASNRTPDVERLVHAELRAVLGGHGGPGKTPAGHDRLTGLGLTSLQLAEIAARLVARLGVDPFARSLALTEVRTVGDLCRAFATAVAGTPRAIGSSAELGAARRRAEARRDRPGR